MAEPRIQYAKTSDGVSIAYAVFGEGPLIVFTSGMFGGLHMKQGGGWWKDRISAETTLASAGWSVALYDSRGAGSSEREITDFSLDARLSDLNAVIEKLAVERFPLVSAGGGATGVAYAVSHPERVSHLILQNPYAKGAQFSASLPSMRVARAMKEMAAEEWEFFTCLSPALPAVFATALRPRTSPA